jgi:hypothetical protein
VHDGEENEVAEPKTMINKKDGVDVPFTCQELMEKILSSASMLCTYADGVLCFFHFVPAAAVAVVLVSNNPATVPWCTNFCSGGQCDQV